MRGFHEAEERLFGAVRSRNAAAVLAVHSVPARAWPEPWPFRRATLCQPHRRVLRAGRRRVVVGATGAGRGRGAAGARALSVGADRGKPDRRSVLRVTAVSLSAGASTRGLVERTNAERVLEKAAKDYLP